MLLLTSVVFDSVRPHRWQPNRLRHPWDSPGKNTGVGCHFLLQRMKVKSESEVAQLCLTLSDPMDCSPSGSSIHGIFQARVLEWVAIAFYAAFFMVQPLLFFFCPTLISVLVVFYACYIDSFCSILFHLNFEIPR